MNPTESRPPRVLIAEGDPWVRDMLLEMLMSVRSDVRLEICENGAQVLSALTTQPDLIIAARELHGVDGLDLLRRVRASRDKPGLPFILMSDRCDIVSVREAIPHKPTAYLSKPLDLDHLRKRLEYHLLDVCEQVRHPTPAVQLGVSLSAFLKERRTTAHGSPLFADLRMAVARAASAHGLHLRELEEELRNDPQITGALIAAANSAASYCDTPLQSLSQALNKLGVTRSMNLLLGFALKSNARLNDPLLAKHAECFVNRSLQVADLARGLARMLNLDEERCYCAGLLHCLGDLAVLRSLQEWRMVGGELDEELVQLSLDEHSAPFGSALRTRWRLPLQLRELIAAIYQLSGGVYSQDSLVMNLAGQLASTSPTQDDENIASCKAARMLKVGLPELNLLREPSTQRVIARAH